MTKDLFSGQADVYALYRPSYPDELFTYITSFVAHKDTAWDCATGNGQAATKLADYFKSVQATDISPAQLAKAVQKQNITYSLTPAESTPFADDTFDLITIATAYHWVNWELFKKEATRVSKEGAVIAAWTYYALLTDDVALQDLYHHFYRKIIYSYWDKERRYVDEQYQTIDFPYEPLPSQPFHTELVWTREQFKGYLESWSAVQHYKEAHNTSPHILIEEDLARLWPVGETKKVTFPIALRLGRIHK
jgi:ubiquinone/menaquinone biosynthesis C-methylase UbiE